ncbi:MAG: RidA family protein [Bacteroidota bacterium]
MNKIIINSSKAPEPLGPYSQAVMVNDTLYLSGQIAIDQSKGSMVNGSIQKETHQVMKNISFVLEAAGLNFTNVVKCSIFIKDMNDFKAINEEYGKFFDSSPPARETVEVSRLPKDVNVEISCIAVK